MSELADFLRARITEGEESWCEWGCHERARAEAAALRLVVDRCEGQVAYGLWLTTNAANAVMEHLAGAYADHADYRPEWAP